VEDIQHFLDVAASGSRRALRIFDVPERSVRTSVADGPDRQGGHRKGSGVEPG